MGSERIEELERQIAELKRRWPAHSVPPTMLQQLDELEEGLEREVNKAASQSSPMYWLWLVRSGLSRKGNPNDVKRPPECVETRGVSVRTDEGEL